MSSRAHFLYDFDVPLQALGIEGVPGTPDMQVSAAAEDDAYGRSIAFLRSTAEQNRRVLVFGAPPQIHELCQRIAADGRRLPLQFGSLVISGGGWKRFGDLRVARSELLDIIEQRLAVDAAHAIDAFSTAELNCVFMTCREGRYHIPPLVEPLLFNADLTPMPEPVGVGILGVLDPFALSYPGFIVTGDLVELVSDPCACGLTGSCIVGEIRRAPGHLPKGCGGVMASIRG
jgi:hypothetical protein